MQFSIVEFSKLQEHPEFRMDSECYKQYHLDVEKAITSKMFKTIQYYSSSVINFGAYSLCNNIIFQTSGRPFLVTEDIKNNIIEMDKLHYISENVHALLYKSHCSKGQVLLTMAGAYLGKAAVYNENFECSSNQAIAKITLKPDAINPYYLSTFLNCRHGQSQIERFRTGTGQPNLNLGLIKFIKVVEATFQFQALIEQIVNDALGYRKNAVSAYSIAENIVLAELGLSNWQSQHCLTFIRYYSETQAASRIDAEYFQPKYQEIVRAIKNYAGGWDTLGNLVTVKKCVEVGSSEYLEAGIPFVRVSNLSPFEITEEKYISEELYEEIKQHQPQPGEILFSKDATPGIAHYLNEASRKMIPSGGILRLKRKSDQISNEYLTLVLNSVLTKEQVNRDVGGSIILHWRTDQVKATAIPLLPQSKQHQIQQKVIESFNLRQQSKQLLECAKRAVELAIEQDEQTAINWLQDQMHTINPETTT